MCEAGRGLHGLLAVFSFAASRRRPKRHSTHKTRSRASRARSAASCSISAVHNCGHIPHDRQRCLVPLMQQSRLCKLRHMSSARSLVTAKRCTCVHAPRNTIRRDFLSGKSTVRYDAPALGEAEARSCSAHPWQCTRGYPARAVHGCLQDMCQLLRRQGACRDTVVGQPRSMQCPFTNRCLQH